MFLCIVFTYILFLQLFNLSHLSISLKSQFYQLNIIIKKLELIINTRKTSKLTKNSFIHVKFTIVKPSIFNLCRLYYKKFNQKLILKKRVEYLKINSIWFWTKTDYVYLHLSKKKGCNHLFVNLIYFNIFVVLKTVIADRSIYKDSFQKYFLVSLIYFNFFLSQ